MLNPTTVLLDFMGKMNAWEKLCASRTEQCIAGAMKFDVATKVGMAEYMLIFNQYCSPSKAIPRDYYYDEPPDYDPIGEVIVNQREDSLRIIEIQTQQNYGHRKKHIFRMAFEGGGWRIVERVILLDNNDVLDASL